MGSIIKQNLPSSGESGSLAIWRLHYYQWAMQIFEQYGMGEGACHFALAALEQVDDVLGPENGDNDEDLPEAASTIRGRLWANVFKFSLDLKHYEDAYCAIISNPDEDSKSICLRRFIIVLCEFGATKVVQLSWYSILCFAFFFLFPCAISKRYFVIIQAFYIVLMRALHGCTYLCMGHLHFRIWIAVSVVLLWFGLLTNASIDGSLFNIAFCRSTNLMFWKNSL